MKHFFNRSRAVSKCRSRVFLMTPQPCSMLTQSSYSYGYILTKNVHSMKPIYHHELQSIINKQINTEQHASQHYLAVASYFGKLDVSRKGCFSYFMSLYNDELHHTVSLVQYQLLRGGNIILDTIDPPSILDSACLPEYFEDALKLEYSHTDSLQNIIKMAQSYEDYHCVDFITTHLLKDQIASTRSLVTLIQTLKSFNNTHEGFYIFDKDLIKRYPLKKGI